MKSFKDDIFTYLKTFRNYDRIIPILRVVGKENAKGFQIEIFHDDSVTIVGALIYLLVTNEKRVKTIHLFQTGSKLYNTSMTVLKHESRSCRINLLIPFVNVLPQKFPDKKMDISIVYDSTCSLKLLKNNVRPTSK